MRRLIFGPEYDPFHDNVRRFFQSEVAPHGARWREQGFVDREIYKKAGEQAVMLIWADEAYGGPGIRDFQFDQIIIEENISHGEIGFYINLRSNLVAPYIAALGGEDLKQRILPGCISGDLILAVAMKEPDAGSDLAGLPCNAGRLTNDDGAKCKLLASELEGVWSMRAFSSMAARATWRNTGSAGFIPTRG